MKTYLRADGWSVDHTPDPSEALKFACCTKYEVVVTDLVMRGMTGLDLYREIRYHNGEVKFVFLLSMSGEALRDRIEANLARQSVPELSAIRLVRARSDLSSAMPRFVTAFLEAELPA